MPLVPARARANRVKEETPVFGRAQLEERAAQVGGYCYALPNAYGEIYGGHVAAMTIPSEASGSTKSTEEPLERRAPSSACSNEPHECPASLVDDDVRRSPVKAGSRDNNPCEDIETN